MSIAILGAGGFVGSHLVEYLLARGDRQVVGVDRSAEKLAGIGGSGFTFHLADVRRDTELVDGVIASAETVIDLVAYANPSLYVATPLEVVDTNFLTNLDIVERCVRHGVKLIQYSSAEVYGSFDDHTGVADEDETALRYGPVQKQRWIYACAKQLLERVIHAHGLRGDLEFTIIRPFNFLGPRIDYLVEPGSMGGPRVFAHFLSALLGGGPLHLVDGGSVSRTFLAVSEASEALGVVLDQREATRSQIYNVGNPENNVTIAGFAELMKTSYEELTGTVSPSPLIDISGVAFYGEGYEDADRRPPRIDKLARLGWKPEISLTMLLRDTIGWYLDHPDALGPVSPAAPF